MIIYNEGNTPARQNPIFVDNQPDPPATIAAVISSYTLGNDLLQAYKAGKNPTVDFKVYGGFTDRFLNQVIAETKGGDPNHVVVVGAHLDSVPDGPGINDDGSGTATLLARPRSSPTATTTCARRSASPGGAREENGLVGSTYYAHNLSQKEVDKIDVMLDYDMLASPNYARWSMTATATTPTDRARAGPEGSGKVEAVFDDWFRSQRPAERARSRSTAARTTSASPTAASPRAASSPAPRRPRPRSRRRSTAAPRARGWTRATTRSATTCRRS